MLSLPGSEFFFNLQREKSLVIFLFKNLRVFAFVSIDNILLRREIKSFLLMFFFFFLLIWNLLKVLPVYYTFTFITLPFSTNHTVPFLIFCPREKDSLSFIYFIFYLRNKFFFAGDRWITRISREWNSNISYISYTYYIDNTIKSNIFFSLWLLLRAIVFDLIKKYRVGFALKYLDKINSDSLTEKY